MATRARAAGKVVARTPEKLVREFPQRKKRTASGSPGKSRAVKRAASMDGNTLSVLQSQAFDDSVSPASQELLRDFDLDIKYGPCAGVSRTIRYERAVKFGLNPPSEVKKLLVKFRQPPKEEKPGTKKERSVESSIWEGRI